MKCIPFHYTQAARGRLPQPETPRHPTNSRSSLMQQAPAAQRVPLKQEPPRQHVKQQRPVPPPPAPSPRVEPRQPSAPEPAPSDAPTRHGGLIRGRPMVSASRLRRPNPVKQQAQHLTDTTRRLYQRNSYGGSAPSSPIKSAISLKGRQNANSSRPESAKSSPGVSRSSSPQQCIRFAGQREARHSGSTPALSRLPRSGIVSSPSADVSPQRPQQHRSQPQLFHHQKQSPVAARSQTAEAASDQHVGQSAVAVLRGDHQRGHPLQRQSRGGGLPLPLPRHSGIPSPSSASSLRPRSSHGLPGHGCASNKDGGTSYQKSM